MALDEKLEDHQSCSDSVEPPSVFIHSFIHEYLYLICDNPSDACQPVGAQNVILSMLLFLRYFICFIYVSLILVIQIRATMIDLLKRDKYTIYTIFF